MFDVIIIGAGSAGLSAAWHAKQNKLKSLVISKGVFLGEGLYGIDFSKIAGDVEKGEVVSLDKNIVSFSVETKSGEQYYAKAVIIASGCLNLEGNSAFDRVTLKDSFGKIFVDANLQSNVPGIFAAGDVAVTLAKGQASAILEGGKAALSLDKILKNGDN